MTKQGLRDTRFFVLGALTSLAVTCAYAWVNACQASVRVRIVIEQLNDDIATMYRSMGEQPHTPLYARR